MVFMQPTTYALINITDFPFFVVPLNEIEHVHFERVFSSSKTCDVKIIMKVGSQKTMKWITAKLGSTPHPEIEREIKHEVPSVITGKTKTIARCLCAAWCIVSAK